MMMSRKDIHVKRLRIAIGLLVLGMLAFHLVFKQRIDENDVKTIRRMFGQHTDYTGNLAPDFELTLLNGETFRLADALGEQVIVLNFFTTWCGPCREEMPELDRFYREYREKGVLLLGIAVGETPAQTAAYADELNLSFPVAADETRGTAAQYRLEAYPTTVVITPDGYILLYETGAISSANVTLVPLVKQMLDANGTEFNRDYYLEQAPRFLTEEGTGTEETEGDEEE